MVRVRTRAATAAGIVLTIAALAGAVPASAGAPTARIVVTTGDDAAAAAVGADLRAHGAKHLRPLPVVHGFSAEVAEPYVAQLRRTPGVRTVTVDGTLRMQGVDPALGYDPVQDFGSLHNVARVLHADDAYGLGYTGKGVDVALIDSGVAPVQGLRSGNVVNGPDLSFESQSASLRHLDTFGHGTHMASIINGRDAVKAPAGYQDPASFTGVAPDARLVSVKVADHSGTTDVSQVIAAIDWVVAHRNDNGLNIRVLNLSFGTDSAQSPRLDPLCYAVENAWRKGIVVVVSGGNAGREAAGLSNPAQDPYVIAVGASDPRDTVNASDDVVAPFSSKGNSTRRVDVVAPGVHVLGLRNPNSAIDQAVPAARVGTRFFRGSGTSQAAAAVSGAAAVLLQRYPNLTPDQVKKHLANTATPFEGATVNYRGNGLVNVRRAVNQTPPSVAAAAQSPYGWSTGTGSLEAARGSRHIGDATGWLTGERDIFGRAWDGATWASATASGTAWDGGNYLGAAWSGSSWSADDWTGAAWSGASWSGASWSGAAWSDDSWSGHYWSGDGWNGAAWSGSSWSGASWSGASWSGASWSGSSWSGASWSGASWSGASWSSATWE